MEAFTFTEMDKVNDKSGLLWLEIGHQDNRVPWHLPSVLLSSHISFRFC